MVRRQVLKGLFAGSAVFAVSGCGGGGASSSTGLSAATAGGIAPAPTPTPTPPPVPSLKGVTIDQAEAEIANALASNDKWMATRRSYQTETTVSNADEFLAAIGKLFDVGANAATLSINQRILCAWNGDSELTAGKAARVTIGGKGLGQTFLSQGGSVVIAAAPGYAPNFSNSVWVAGAGIKFEGIGFTRTAAAGENNDAISAVVLFKNSTYPVTTTVGFENCVFGTRDALDRTMSSKWVNGLATNGQVADYVSLVGCTFRGHQNAAVLATKLARVDRCDFQGVSQDCIALRGHTLETGYHAYAWVSNTTFRNSADSWEARSEHSDTIQTGTKSDRHLGYRLLVTDVISHLSRSYSGEAGMGGGTQGIYNDDHPTADNQFVIRRSAFLTTSPHGFAYYSPQATRPSFVDQSVFTRAGRVPSAFAPDPLSQDMAVGITGSEPANGPWLLVTNTFAKNMMSQGSITPSSVDPRLQSIIAGEERPETLFVGRDFSRGGPAVNGLAGKFGYDLPNEAAKQSAFVADVWANFRARGGAPSSGIPNPTTLAWIH